MRERISEYISTLDKKDTSGDKLAARVCAEYFDERGIDYPAVSDWEAFKEYYRPVYEQEKGKPLSETTLQQNYVARAQKFYRWCMAQDKAQTPAPAITEQAIPVTQSDEAQTPPPETQSARARKEAEKPVRTSLLIDAETYRLLALLSALEDKTMTEILTAGARMYIEAHSHEAEILRTAIEARSKA